MKRAKKSQNWREFIHKAAHDYEVITRYGKPDFLHKKGTPLSAENIWAVFFAKESGSWSKNQILGMKLFSALGIKIFKYGTTNGSKPNPERFIEPVR